MFLMYEYKKRIKILISKNLTENFQNYLKLGSFLEWDKNSVVTANFVTICMTVISVIQGLLKTFCNMASLNLRNQN